jgi:monoamine oxidase
MPFSLYGQFLRRYRPELCAGPGREDALKATVAASAGLLPSSDRPTPRGSLDRRPDLADSRSAASHTTRSLPVETNNRSQATGLNKRVIIVGAGFAGLSCAHELKSLGYDVVVVEARPRIGGRVVSFRDFIPGKTAEGGGEYIGLNHPHWWAYKTQFGLEYVEVVPDDADTPIVLGGQRLDKAASDAIWAEMDTAFKPLIGDATGVNIEEPWLSPNAKELDYRSTADWLDGLPVSQTTKQAIAAEFEGNNAVPMDRQSYLGNLVQIQAGGGERYFTDTEVFRLRGGNQLLAECLADTIGRENVLMGLAVKSIATSESGVVVALANGKVLIGDDVVLTVPPSTWRKIKFTPSLPRALSPQMGANVKYIAAVKNRFWKQLDLSPEGMTDGDISSTWESTDSSPDDSGIAMTAYSGGPAAENARASYASDKDAAYGPSLDAMYPDFSKNLVRSQFVDWPGDQWSKGGYTFPSPGQIVRTGPTLYNGIGNLHFAGEHTCYKFVGFMEGALESGVRVAKKLARRDKVMTPAMVGLVK